MPMHDLAYRLYRQRYQSSATPLTVELGQEALTAIKKAHIALVAEAERLHATHTTSVETLRSTVEAAAFDIVCQLSWGFARMCDHLQQQQQTMRSILEVMENRLAAESRELKRRAERAYIHGWTDEALADFLKSRELNYQDFSIHLYLGNLYFFDIGDSDQAVSSYLAAAKYSRPFSPQFSARALCHAAFVRRLARDYEGAHAATSEALAVDDHSDDIQYEHAITCCLVGNTSEALKWLTASIMTNRLRAPQAIAEADLESIRAELTTLIGNLTIEESRRASAQVELLSRICQDLRKRDRDRILAAVLAQVTDRIEALRSQLNRNTYLEVRMAADLAQETSKFFSRAGSEAIAERRRQIQLEEVRVQKSLADIERKYKPSMNNEFTDTPLGDWWGIGAFYLGFIALWGMIAAGLAAGCGGILLVLGAYALYWWIMWWCAMTVWERKKSPLLSQGKEVGEAGRRASELLSYWQALRPGLETSPDQS
jgi:tetratricopeptide (TPR) repeat protein